MKEKPIIELQKASVNQYDYWLLINFEKVRYDNQDERSRCLEFISTKAPDFFNTNNWNLKNRISVYVPEENLVTLRLGNIFNSKGENVKTNLLEESIHISKHTLKIERWGNKYVANHDDSFFYGTILSDTCKNRYYHLSSTKGNLFYISTALIAQFFYYKSTKLITYLLHYVNEDDNGIYRQGDSDLYLFNSKIINTNDVIHLVKFNYINNENEKSGRDILNHSLIKFYEVLTNYRKNYRFNNSVFESEIIYKFPFDRPLDIEVKAQKISENKYIVYSIDSVKSKYPLFKKNKMMFLNINDPRVVDQYLNDEVKGYILTLPSYNDSIKSEEQYDYDYNDINSKIESIPNKIDIPFFSSVPEYDILDKEKSLNKHELKKINDFLVESLAISSNNRSNSSAIQGVNSISYDPKNTDENFYREMFTQLKSLNYIIGVKYLTFEFDLDMSNNIIDTPYEILIHEGKYIILKIRLKVKEKSYDFFLIHKTSEKRMGVVYLSHSIYSNNKQTFLQVKNFLESMNGIINFPKYYYSNKSSKNKEYKFDDILKKYGLIVLKSINIKKNIPLDLLTKNLEKYLLTFIRKRSIKKGI
ncbi:MAG: hypothetical protein N4A45_07095 [Flavobacteriales bacterium]|jgi:hypothetical protein|nr:hypothetical protein [Flavobacteriales bacterium]